MKKILLLMVIGILLLAELGVVAVHDEAVKQEKTMLSFSRLSIKEEDEYVSLELEGTNSVLMKKDHYMVPTYIETFMFPFGTEIIDVQCIYNDIHRQSIAKELIVAPEPIIAGQTSSNIKEQRDIIPMTVDTWFEYDVGTGIDKNERCVFVKVQIFPVQYYPLENTIEWAGNVEIDINYKEPERSAISLDDEYDSIYFSRPAQSILSA